MLGSSTTICSGIHVGADAIYAVELARRRSRVSLTHCAAVDLDDALVLPEQLVEDVSRRQLVDALRELKRRGLSVRRPFFALTGTATFVKRRFLLPKAEAETRDHLLWEAGQFLAEDVDEYVLDVLMTRRYGFVVAVRRQILELYGVLCREAGVEAPGFDVCSFALCNALEGCGAVAGRGAELIYHSEPGSARGVLLRDGEYTAETSWSTADGEPTDCLARLCDTELDEGERAARLWLSGPQAPTDRDLLAELAESVRGLDPFDGLSLAPVAQEELSRSGLDESAFAMAAGLAFRALADA